MLLGLRLGRRTDWIQELEEEDRDGKPELGLESDEAPASARRVALWMDSEGGETMEVLPKERGK